MVANEEDATVYFVVKLSISFTPTHLFTFHVYRHHPWMDAVVWWVLVSTFSFAFSFRSFYSFGVDF